MNFGLVLKAFDAAVAVRDVAKRVRGTVGANRHELAPILPSQNLTTASESRLTNVVVAALKEAFDRDHARLELERAQLDEQRRRAEDALRMELRRQAADRELGRLRLLAGTALVGWLGSIAVLGWRVPLASPLSRITLALGWLLLLAALGTAFAAMGRVGALEHPQASAESGRAATVPLWLMILGLAFTAATLLL